MHEAKIYSRWSRTETGWLLGEGGLCRAVEGDHVKMTGETGSLSQMQIWGLYSFGTRAIDKRS